MLDVLILRQVLYEMLGRSNGAVKNTLSADGKVRKLRINGSFGDFEHRQITERLRTVFGRRFLSTGTTPERPMIRGSYGGHFYVKVLTE